METQFIVFGVLALIGGLVLAWVTTRTVVRPVNALIHASQEIARGDLDHPDVSGGDGTEMASLRLWRGTCKV